MWIEMTQRSFNRMVSVYLQKRLETLLRKERLLKILLKM